MNIPLIEFRQATPADLDDIIRIFKAVITEQLLPLADPLPDHYTDEGERFDFFYDLVNRTTLMIVDENTIGFGIIKEGLLKFLMIELEQQKNAYGAFFMEELEKQLQRNEGLELHVRCPLELEYGLSFFKNLGYQIYENQEEGAIHWVHLKK
ncbi:hypothetical protein [Persicobacter psychrovividus]|uniref:N-acetyltransferase domain-containing protein n=1 Tax=Persicobacter psychrovividus TaxID=387638 RepID=A0ABN6LDM3_9BACT|nr:hypothetical protein PEPS_17720 [Persicobacter psychrovividus]